MANPNQARDQRGRFARSGSSRGDSSHDRKMAEREQRNLNRAKISAEIFDQQDRLAEQQQIAQRLAKTRPSRRDDPHDVVDWEKQNVANRERLRKIRARIKELRSTKP